MATLRGLGLEIVVEGIENEGQLELIARLGCDLGQGFLIGKSMTADQAEALIVSGPSFKLKTSG